MQLSRWRNIRLIVVSGEFLDSRLVARSASPLNGDELPVSGVAQRILVAVAVLFAVLAEKYAF